MYQIRSIKKVVILEKISKLVSRICVIKKSSKSFNTHSLDKIEQKKRDILEDRRSVMPFIRKYCILLLLAS